MSNENKGVSDFDIGIASLILWVAIVFGYVHCFLAIGILLILRMIFGTICDYVSYKVHLRYKEKEKEK